MIVIKVNDVPREIHMSTREFVQLRCLQAGQYREVRPEILKLGDPGTFEGLPIIINEFADSAAIEATKTPTTPTPVPWWQKWFRVVVVG